MSSATSLSSFPKHSSCLVCGSSKIAPLKGYERHFLASCNACGFVFTHRIPSGQELNDHYASYNRNLYISPITIKRYEDLLDSFEKYRKTSKILDVGCDVGNFLDVARGKGWEVYGVEFSDDAVAKCREKGIHMQQGELNPDHYTEGMFDIVTSFEVIEHINYPVKEMTSIAKILRKGGLFYATTPNFDALERRFLKADYNIICYPEHLSYYTPSTINRLLKSTGFKKKRIETTGISFTRLKTSMGKSDQAFISASSDDEKLRVEIEKKKWLQFVKNTINWTLTLFGVGMSLKVWYEKA